MYQGREWGEFLIESQVPTVRLTKASTSSSLETKWGREMAEGVKVCFGEMAGAEGASSLSIHPALGIARSVGSSADLTCMPGVST